MVFVLNNSSSRGGGGDGGSVLPFFILINFEGKIKNSSAYTYILFILSENKRSTFFKNGRKMRFLAGKMSFYHRMPISGGKIRFYYQFGG